MFSVTLCLNNGFLLRQLKRKRWLENQIQLASEGDSEIDMLLTGACMRFYTRGILRFLGLFRTIESYTVELSRLCKDISQICERDKGKYVVSNVFVVFNTEESQRKCLRDLSVGAVLAYGNWSRAVAKENLFHGNVLFITEAPEPSAIFYENLDSGIFQRLKENITSWFILGIGLLITYYSVGACFNGGQPALAAILITGFNSFFPELIRILVTNFEASHTNDELENSFIAKTISARCFCSTVILYIKGLDHSPQIISPYYIGSIQAVLLADAVGSPIIRMLDPFGSFNQNVLARFAGSDQRARMLQLGTDYLLAEKYMELATSMFMSMFFSAVFPLGYFYSVLGCITSFCADKYCFLRVYRQKPPQSDKLIRITRSVTAVVILVHSVITCRFYYSWPFDSLVSVSISPPY